MILPEKVGKRKGRGFHTTIVTSFAVDFRAFEEILLPQILASGATNIVLIADERMSALSLSDGSMLPTQLGRDYALHTPRASAGLFHPKIILQIGREGGRVFVGSANATAAGLVGNAEIAIEISCDAEPSPHQAFVRSVWHHLERALGDAEGAVHDAVLWARDRAKWITEPAEQVVQALPDGSLLGFFAVPGRPGILERFAEQLADTAVERLIVVSPYWDDDLAALDSLQNALKPAEIDVILDMERHDFPREAAMPTSVRLLPLGEHFGSRFTHAKLIIAQTAEHDHILSGSANCTVAALGRIGFRGTNAEACTYRRVEAGAAAEALGLTALLAQAAMPATSLPDLICREPIPLESLVSLRPGRFEIDHNVLLWHLPTVPDWSRTKAEILDGDGDLLADAFPQLAFEFDRANLRAILFALALLLRIFIVVKFALDAAGGAVEHVGDGPEQVFEVGFEPGVEHSRDQRIEDVGNGARSHPFLRQWPGIGFVREGAVAVEGQFVEEMRGWGCLMVGLMIVGQVGCHGKSPSPDMPTHLARPSWRFPWPDGSGLHRQAQRSCAFAG
jgi:hypothetical protein